MFINNLLLSTALLLVSINAYALQIVEPVEGQNSFVKISEKETTRLFIEGGKIDSLIATDGELTVEKDVERGQLFIRPSVRGKPINVRVISSRGATYNLVMNVIDIPQADVSIREPFSVRSERNLAGSAGKKVEGTGMDRTVRSLVAAMASDEPPKHIEVTATSKEFALWDKTKFVMVAVINERDLTGEKYQLTNLGKSSMRLVEQEFYQNGVVAVAIENMLLEPGETTNVYVVRGN